MDTAEYHTNNRDSKNVGPGGELVAFWRVVRYGRSHDFHSLLTMSSLGENRPPQVVLQVLAVETVESVDGNPFVIRNQDDRRLNKFCYVVCLYGARMTGLLDWQITENPFKSHATTGVLAPVASCTGAAHPLNSPVDPEIVHYCAYRCLTCSY